MYQFLHRPEEPEKVLFTMELIPINPTLNKPRFLAYTTADEVDIHARSLSLHVSDHRVRVFVGNRTKVVYEKGERICTHSIDESNTGYSDEHKRCFKMKCSETGGWF